MMAPRKEPTIPLSVAEMLYVVLDTARQSDQLDARTKENVGLILATYRTRRDVSIKAQGFDDIDVSHYVEAAAEALANWLDDRALKAELEDQDQDFAEFEKEFTNERKAEDPNQGSDEGGEHPLEGDDRARGTHYEGTAGGGWSPDGGGTDPGAQGFTE